MMHDATSEILTAVRAYCRACCGGSVREVERCNRADCTLHPYRSTGAYAARKRGEIAGKLSGQMDIDDYVKLIGVSA